MKTRTSIHRIEMGFSCQENWEEMPEVGGQKMCGRCQQSLVDFSSMSKNEVIKYLENSQGKPCGRFSHEQLQEINSYLKIKRAEKQAWRKPLLLGGLLLGLNTHIQGQTQKPEISQMNSSCQVSESLRPGYPSWVTLQKIKDSSDPGIHLRGILIDEYDVPLVGGRIQIHQNSPDNPRLGGVFTDPDGMFEFQIDSIQPTPNSHFLEVYYLGYPKLTFSLHDINHQEIRISLADTMNNFTIEGKYDGTSHNFPIYDNLSHGVVRIRRPWYTRIGWHVNFRVKDLVNRIIR